jgi:hypothetical protein
VRLSPAGSIIFKEVKQLIIPFCIPHKVKGLQNAERLEAAILNSVLAMMRNILCCLTDLSYHDLSLVCTISLKYKDIYPMG